MSKIFHRLGKGGSLETGATQETDITTEGRRQSDHESRKTNKKSDLKRLRRTRTVVPVKGVVSGNSMANGRSIVNGVNISQSIKGGDLKSRDVRPIHVKHMVTGTPDYRPSGL